MTEAIQLIDRRSIPARGAEVHAYDYGSLGHVILFADRLIAAQQLFPDIGEARPYARALADAHRCALIEHDCRPPVPEASHA